MVAHISNANKDEMKLRKKKNLYEPWTQSFTMGGGGGGVGGCESVPKFRQAQFMAARIFDPMDFQ